MLANAALGYVQEGRAEDASRRVRQLLAPRARVVRDGRSAEIDADALVPGDLVLLRAGDRVPADGRLVEASVSRSTSPSSPASRCPPRSG